MPRTKLDPLAQVQKEINDLWVTNEIVNDMALFGDPKPLAEWKAKLAQLRAKRDELMKAARGASHG